MKTVRELRNGELVDITYNDHGDEVLVHWAGHHIPLSSGRYPWPISKEIGHEENKEELFNGSNQC